jgi:hypothetical protein
MRLPIVFSRTGTGGVRSLIWSRMLGIWEKQLILLKEKPVLEWILGIALFSLYIVCLFTVCSLTFHKGHTLLGIVGIFVPFLWLIGAVLPPKDGSAWDMAQRQRYLQSQA